MRYIKNISVPRSSVKSNHAFDGEGFSLSVMKNVSDRCYPSITPRGKRAILGKYGKIAAFLPDASIERRELPDGSIAYVPDSYTAGVVFYPGGKVEHTAYEPLLQTLAAEGVLCALVEVPLRLAILDVDAAEGIAEQYPEIENWYIGGHSLGGSAAAMYVAEHTNEFAGLILLGSYSTVDLSEGELEVLSVYGSEDKVLNKENYLESKENLPQDFIEFIIEGGCHAYFGVYGEQAGDGTPTISNVEQIQMTVEIMLDFME